jgi:hypothetical protein
MATLERLHVGISLTHDGVDRGEGQASGVSSLAVALMARHHHTIA